MDILQIYGQEAWHDEVKIVGTKEALQKLSKALQNCLERNWSQFDTFVSDGEGYTIKLKMVEEDSAELKEMPYLEEYAK